MKRIVSLLLVMVILLGMNSIGFANEKAAVLTDKQKEEMQKEIDELDLIDRLEEKKNNPDKKDTVTLNEYDFFVEFEKTPESTLQSLGYDKETIALYKDFRSLYEEHVDFLSKFSSEELSDKGYSSDQITVIENYAGTDEEMALLAASADVDLDIDYCEYSLSTERTTSRLYLTFVWNTLPIIKMNDFIAIGWGEPWEIGGKAANIKYEDKYNSNNTKWEVPTYIAEGDLEGGGYKFRAAIDDNTYAVKEGYCIFVISKAGMNQVFAQGRYDRQIFGWTFSYDVNLSVSGIIEWFLSGFGTSYVTTKDPTDEPATLSPTTIP